MHVKLLSPKGLAHFMTVLLSGSANSHQSLVWQVRGEGGAELEVLVAEAEDKPVKLVVYWLPRVLPDSLQAWNLYAREHCKTSSFYAGLGRWHKFGTNPTQPPVSPAAHWLHSGWHV